MHCVSSNNKLTLVQLVLGTCLVISALLALANASEDERLRVENRKVKDNGQDLTETINYLEGVDKYYSQLSRPRFGRSEYKQMGSGFADRQAPAYRMVPGDALAQQIRWSLDKNAYPVNNNPNRYTVSLGDMLRRRLAEQQSASYDQQTNFY